MKRNHTGHRVGECHHRAKHPDATVKRARKLKEYGFSYTEIADEVGAHWRTIADWCNYATRFDD